MRTRLSELDSFIETTLIKIKAGIRNVRDGEESMMVELPEEVNFQIELINDADGVADVTMQTTATTGSDTDTTPEVVETEVEAAAVQTETMTEQAATQTTVEAASQEITIEGGGTEVTSEGASTDSHVTSGTASRETTTEMNAEESQSGSDSVSMATNGGDRTTVDKDYEEF